MKVQLVQIDDDGRVFKSDVVDVVVRGNPFETVSEPDEYGYVTAVARKGSWADVLGRKLCEMRDQRTGVEHDA